MRDHINFIGGMLAGALCLAAPALAQPGARTGIRPVDTYLDDCRRMIRLQAEEQLYAELNRIVRERRLTRAQKEDLQVTCVIYWQGLVDGRAAGGRRG